MRALALVFFAVPLVAGCGNNSNTGDPGKTGGIASPADFQTALSLGNCQSAAKCGSIGASEEKACEASAKAALQKYPASYSYADAVTGKRLAFDPKAAQKCIDGFKAAGCTVDQYFAATDACVDVFKPAVQPGGMCMASGECIGGWCDQGKAGSDGCPGTCKANIATGMACDPMASRCGDADFCDVKAKLCTARVSDGTACGSTPKCGRNSFCHGYVAATNGKPEVKGVCGPGGKAGDPCTSYFFGNTDCTPGLFCDDSLPKPVCATRLSNGTACPSTAACADGLDCIGLDFDMNGKVTAKGACAAFVDVNMPCKDPKVQETGCVYDSVCDAASKTCLPVGAENSDCGANGSQGSCGDNLYCDGTSMLCTQSVPLNGKCTPPTGQNADPCHDGSCDPMTKVCVLACM